MLGIWRLQLLREVGRRGTIRAAAAAMSVTPSAVSQQLRILEVEAGLPLLERQGRRVRLTEAGEMLARHAEVINTAMAAAEAELAASRVEVGGTLRIAAFPTAARAILPEVIAELGRAYPRLRITLRDLETDESLVALRLDEVDLAVVDEYDEATRIREPGIDLVELLDDPLFVAVPPGHRLAEHGSGSAPTAPESGSPAAWIRPAGSVSLAEFAEIPWIMDTESSSMFGAIVRQCRLAGFEPKVRSNCRDYSVIIALVEAGLGVAVLPGLALEGRPLRAPVAPLDPPLRRRVLVALRPERRSHPAVAAMLAALRSTRKPEPQIV